MPTMLRAAYLLSHPIQYQSPLLRRLATHSSVDLTVLYASDFSLRTYNDEGFGVPVAWDVPLLDGYRAEFFAAPAGWPAGEFSASALPRHFRASASRQF